MEKNNLCHVSSLFITVSVPEGHLDNFYLSTTGKSSLVLSPRLRTFFPNTIKQMRLKIKKSLQQGKEVSKDKKNHREIMFWKMH